MSILIHFLSINLLTGFFVGIYQFYDKSLTQSSGLKDSFILAQSSKLKNGQSIQLKYQTQYLMNLNLSSQKITNLKNGRKVEIKLNNNF